MATGASSSAPGLVSTDIAVVGVTGVVLSSC
jgi:hypothetical protein